MKKRSILIRILALSLALCLFTAGCGGQDQNASQPEQSGSSSVSAPSSSETASNAEPESSSAGDYPISDEVITVTVSGPQGSTPDWNDTIQVAELEKRLGIKLECNPFPDDSWETQLTLMMASDELPDLIAQCQISMDNMAKYGSDGYFLPINEYLDIAPNLSATMEESPSYKTAVTSPDGNIYGLTTYNGNKITKISRSFINEEWLKRVDKPVPTTVDELYDALVAFRDNDANGNGDAGDEIPFSTAFQGGASAYAERTIMNAFGITSNRVTYVLQEVDGSIQLMDISDNYKEYLRYMNKLYSENLLDQEAFIQTMDEFRAKAKEDRCGFFGDAAPFVAASQPVDYDKNFKWVGGLSSSVCDRHTVVLDPVPGANAIVAINADTEYPTELVRFLDYFFSDEGTLAGARGFEGITFDYNELDGVPGSKIAEVREVEEYPSAEEFRYKKAVINNGFQLVSPFFGTQYPLIIEADDETLTGPILDKCGWAVLIESGTRRDGVVLEDSFPNLVYTADESKERATLAKDISLYLENAKAQFITGKLDIDADWESHVNTLKQMGLDQILKIEQTAYDRMK